VVRGRPPFNNNEDMNLLKINLICGTREVSVPDTPTDYLNLYKLCWDNVPEVRPPIKQVFNKLGKMLNLQNDINCDGDDDHLILQGSCKFNLSVFIKMVFII